MTPRAPLTATSGKLFAVSSVLGKITLLSVVLNCAIVAFWTLTHTPFFSWFNLFGVSLLLQILSGTISGLTALVHYFRTRGMKDRGKVRALAIASIVAALGGGMLVASLYQVLKILMLGNVP